LEKALLSSHIACNYLRDSFKGFVLLCLAIIVSDEGNILTEQIFNQLVNALRDNCSILRVIGDGE
jgi:hypothetical protein